jgi:ketol-acid reductoisomerase
LHGYNIAAKLIAPPEEVDVLLVAPKGVGPEVRRLYEAGKGVAALTGVHRDATGQGRARALAYAKALGCGRAAVFETTFREEAEVDIFGEQAVLCGGLPALIEAAFETLVEAGYPPELAYFDCCHEVKLIADLMDRVGPEGLPDWISDTAAFGGATRGPRMVPDAIRAEMKEILREIRDGRFSQELRQEFEAGRPATRSWSQRLKASRLASAGARLRQIMRG